MDFFAFLVVIFLVIMFIMILPLLSGVGSFGLQKSKNDKKETSSRREKLKQQLDKANVLKFSLKKEDDDETHSVRPSHFDIDSKTGLKKRVIGKYDHDPNSFDFDISDLIEEDQRQQESELKKRTKNLAGKNSKDYQEFV
ncbi:hypothetical protein RNJ44_02016 [Nakaseomyces bracarensis]|uniref:Uncharacterized protein n=1 Tax=Nakaseomyces bracarensis TaxID=273131 RepID=A0ABR4NMF5_9SACH